MIIETKYVNSYGEQIITLWEVEKIEFRKPIEVIENGISRTIAYDNYFHLRRPSRLGSDFTSGCYQNDCKIIDNNFYGKKIKNEQ